MCNHILQISPPVVACHEALLHPQLLEVCWWVECSSDEQVLPPVCVQQYHNSNRIHCCHVCVNYYQSSGSPSFCGRPLVSNVLAINTLEPSSNTLRLVIRLHPNQQQPLQLFVGHSLASTLTSYPGSFPVSCLVPRPCTQAHFLFQALYPGSFPVSCLLPRLIFCPVPHTQAHFLFRASYPGSFPVLCLVPRLISCFVPRTQAHFLFRASYPGSFPVPGLVPRLISCSRPRT